MNRWFQPVVMLTGVMATSRTIAVVECEMPQEVESFEQGVAWVTYCLDNQTDDDIFKPLHLYLAYRTAANIAKRYRGRRDMRCGALSAWLKRAALWND
jgi:hypothetical protein